MSWAATKGRFPAWCARPLLGRHRRPSRDHRQGIRWKRLTWLALELSSSLPRKDETDRTGLVAPRERAVDHGFQFVDEGKQLGRVGGRVFHLLAVLVNEALDSLAGKDVVIGRFELDDPSFRSEEHTSALQSLMRNSYAVFC